MVMMPHPTVRTRFRDWPLAVKSILGFWLFYLLTVIARAFLGNDPGTVIANRGVIIAVGIVLTFGIYAAIALLPAGSGLRRRAAVGGAASLIGAGALSGFLTAADKFLDTPLDAFRCISKGAYRLTEVRNETV